MKTLLAALLIVAVSYAQTFDPYGIDGTPRLSGGAFITTDCNKLQLGEEAPFPNYWADEMSNYLYLNLRLLQAQRDLPNSHRRTFNFPTIGCAEATLDVAATLPANLAKGIFVAGRSYKSFVRFSGYDQETQNQPDAKGLALKVFGVSGSKLLPGYENDNFVDFLFNAYPTLKENNETVLAATVMARTQLMGGGDRGRAALGNWYPLVNQRDIAERNNNTVASVLGLPFYSVSAYKLGTDALPSPAVKYRLFPCNGVAANTGLQNATFAPDHLTTDLTTRLAAGSSCFLFQIQSQVNACEQPINDLAVEWLESRSPFVTVATLNIQQQAISGDLNLTCRHSTFNPWRTIAEHRPLGSANRARLFAYMNGQNQRLSLNLALDPFTPGQHPPGWQYFAGSEATLNGAFAVPAIKTKYPFHPGAGDFHTPYVPPTPCQTTNCP